MVGIVEGVDRRQRVFDPVGHRHRQQLSRRRGIRGSVRPTRRRPGTARTRWRRGRPCRRRDGARAGSAGTAPVVLRCVRRRRTRIVDIGIAAQAATLAAIGRRTRRPARAPPRRHGNCRNAGDRRGRRNGGSPSPAPADRTAAGADRADPAPGRARCVRASSRRDARRCRRCAGHRFRAAGYCPCPTPEYRPAVASARRCVAGNGRHRRSGLDSMRAGRFGMRAA